MVNFLLGLIIGSYAMLCICTLINSSYIAIALKIKGILKEYDAPALNSLYTELSQRANTLYRNGVHSTAQLLYDAADIILTVKDSLGICEESTREEENG